MFTIFKCNSFHFFPWSKVLLSSSPPTMACSGSSWGSWTLVPSWSPKWWPSSCRLQPKPPTQCSVGGSRSKVCMNGDIKNNTWHSSFWRTYLPVSLGKHSAQWALDDVLIGMNDSSRTGFHDKFDGTTPLRHNWYRIQGGEVTVDCLSLDTALTFNSEAIDSESETLLFTCWCIWRRGLVSYYCVVRKQKV